MKQLTKVTFFCLSFLVIQSNGASVVTVTSDPGTGHLGLTRRLTVTCAVSDVSASNAIIGRRDAGSSQSPDDLQYVTSLAVWRDGLALASVTEHSAATALGDLANITVTGSLNGTKGLLTLTWLFPGQGQAGEYTCEGAGVTAQGH